MQKMVEYQCTLHSKEECTDALIGIFSENRYGIIIHDGGSSYQSINYCPWCGRDLVAFEASKEISNFLFGTKK